MIGRILLILVCTAVLLIGSEGRSISKNGRSISKSGRSISKNGLSKNVLELKLSQDDLNRGVAIRITGKTNNKKAHGILSAALKQVQNRRLATHQKVLRRRKQLASLAPKKKENELKLNFNQRAHDKTVVVPRVYLSRNKRSASKEKPALEEREQTKIVDDMDKFNGDDDIIKDVDDYFSEEETAKVVPKQYKGSKSQPSKPSKFVKSEDYGDYAFDTTDTDQFNEDDDLLRRFYTHPAMRRAAFDDYDSFSDLMHAAAAESDHGKGFVKRLYYGDQNNFLNDGVEDAIEDENDTNKEFDGDYDSYEEY